MPNNLSEYPAVIILLEEAKNYLIGMKASYLAIKIDEIINEIKKEYIVGR